MTLQSFSVTTETIVRVFLVAALFLAAYSVRNILLLIFISLVLATILHPLAEWAEKRRIPRGVVVAAVYILGIAAIVGVGTALAPMLIDEVNQISKNFTVYWDKVIAFLPPNIAESVRDWVRSDISSAASAARTGIGSTLSGLLNTAQGVFGAVGSLVVVLVLTYYLVGEQHALRRMIANLVPNTHGPLVERLISNIERRLGGWARGQFLLSLVIGIVVFITLSIIGVPYAFALAVLAALLEFIPYIGPILAGIFAVFFALTVSPTLAIITAIAYYVIQVLENNFIVPKIMQSSAGISPVLSVISVLLCFEIFGVIGVFLGIPIAALLVAVVESMD